MEGVNNIKIAKAPAAENLFTVNTNTINLDAEKSDIFHTKLSK